jgi:hypothetical protein
MCFYIDQKAKRPSDTVVFKVLQRKRWGRGQTWSGPYYSNLAYLPGKVIVARPLEGGKGRIQPFDGDSSYEGIYVFDTEANARNYAATVGSDVAIATLKVNPRSWIATANSVGIKKGSRTYRRAKVISIEEI